MEIVVLDDYQRVARSLGPFEQVVEDITAWRAGTPLRVLTS